MTKSTSARIAIAFALALPAGGCGLFAAADQAQLQFLQTLLVQQQREIFDEEQQLSARGGGCPPTLLRRR